MSQSPRIPERVADHNRRAAAAQREEVELLKRDIEQLEEHGAESASKRADLVARMDRLLRDGSGWGSA